jgi:hypothetical protein
VGAVVGGARVNKTQNTQLQVQLFHLKRILLVEVKDNMKMEFLFLDKYVLRFEEDELPYLNDKLEVLLTDSITDKGEITPEHITGERDIDEEWREDMYLDA